MDQEDFVETYGFSTDDLNQLLERKQYRQLREKVNDLNEADTAEYLEELPDEKRLLVFRMLQKDKASDVFAFLPPDIQKIIIDSFTDPNNVVMGRILDLQSDWQYGPASAMAWVYFLCVIVALGIVSLIISRRVYYYE